MSTRRTRSPLLLSAPVALAACTLALPGAAAAQSCQGAPGASAIQQYCEAVPRGDGGRDTSGGGSRGAGGSGGPGVNAATSKVLAQAGRDGAAVQRLAGGGSGAGDGSTKRKSKSNGKQGSSGQGSAGAGAGSGSAGAGGSGNAASGPKDPSGSPLNAAKNAASTGPAAGQAVAWSIVGLSVLGAIAAVGLRRQRGTLPPVGEHADETTSD